MSETWGDLPKSQEDPTTVDQEIDAKIQNHLDDPDAHLEAGQSLQSHKASEIIDHLARSIVTDKIAHGAVTAYEGDSTIKIGDCVVATENGDYDNIADAIAAGHVNIFLKPGTYQLGGRVDIPSGTKIFGISKFNTIIDMAGDDVSFYLVGSFESLVQDVLFEGLSFINCDSACFVGDYIDNITIRDCLFKDNLFAISFSSDHYNGTVGDIYIRNNEFVNSGFIEISSTYNQTESHCFIVENRFIDCDAYCIMTNTINKYEFFYILDNIIQYTSTKTFGYVIDAVNSWICRNRILGGNVGIRASDCNILDNQLNIQNDYGIYLYSDFSNVRGNAIYQVDGGSHAHGIYVNNSDYSTILNNVIDDCSGDGIRIDSSIEVVVNSNAVSSCNKGVYFMTGSNNCICIGNLLKGNATGVSNSGSGNDIAHNQV